MHVVVKFFKYGMNLKYTENQINCFVTTDFCATTIEVY